ncbi:MAG: hypothetical protein Kow00103_12230 [Candidatus Caldatribacteriota bacterium]
MLKLRNHIPMGAPARREIADGTESDMRVSLGFVPGWYHKRCGIDFSEPWHKDPYYRHQSLKKMKHELCRSFPMIDYWDESKQDDLATLSGCYGAYVIPLVFGFPLIYKKDRWPEINPVKPKLSDQEIDKLNPDKIVNSPFVEELIEQMDIIEKEWGKIHGYLNWQGVLNNAFHLRGEQIFMDFYDKPDLTKYLFEVITEVMIKLAKMVQKRQRETGFYINHFSVSNCTLNMISPETYQDFLLPLDQKIASNFERFGFHTCNWNVTPYIEKIKKIPKLGYLDMGIMSNLARVKSEFPETRRALIYSPERLLRASLEEIKRDMVKVYLELSPCDIVMADIEADTPDNKVKVFIDICKQLVS